jgi:cation diffusion facilitator CzcD-associated flavoprotein CzcO
MTDPETLPVVIVGAGFSGLGMAIRLKQAGIHDFAILERASRVGGTWRENTYPGCACDVPSLLYSFSFAPNPNWSRIYSPASEIQAYLLRLVRNYDLERHIRFDSDLRGGRWNDSRGCWELATNHGPLNATVVISATGPLIEPSIPTLPGLDSFTGTVFHSSRWNHDHNLKGRQIAVIGTGASAIQFIPAVQRRAKHMTLFQRTAPWVLPKLDRSTGLLQREFLRRVPPLNHLLRGGVSAVAETYGLGLYVDQRLLLPMEALGRRHLRREVPDPELRHKLQPNFRLGCKRTLFSNTYYRALTRANVSVVTETIREVHANAIVTQDGTEHEVDTIVFGTGFKIPSGPAIERLLGRDGQTVLGNRASADIEAHLGTTFAGFPNLFMIVGPNTGLGHNSLLHMIESQIAYVRDAIKTMRALDLGAVEVSREAQRRSNRYIQRHSQNTVWLRGGCESWYLNADGKNTSLWPRSTFSYRWRTRRFDTDNYHLRPVSARVQRG